MKKLLSILLAVVLTLSVCTVAAFAADEDIVVSIESVSAKRGETVDVSIALTKNSGFVTLGIEVGYDSSVLEMSCPKHTDGKNCKPAYTQKTDFGEDCGSNIAKNSQYHTVNPYKFMWAYQEGYDVTYTGEIVKITFKVKEDAKIGASDLTVTVTESSNADGKKNTFASTNGTVTVECANHVKDAGTVTKQPTCTEPGETVYKCSVCGAVMATEKAPAATDHKYGEWEVTTPATCTAKGVETRVCANDASHKETREIDALGHKYGEWEVTTPATCTEKGVETRVCANDASHKETREIDALGHKWGEWKVTTEATCTEKGTETRTCSVCDETETRDIDPLGHKIEWTVTKEPTLTEEGKREGICSVCNEKVEEDMPKLTTSINTDENSDLEASITTDEADPFNGYTAAAIIENDDVATDPIDGKDVIGGYGLAIADLDAADFIDGEKVVTVKMKLTSDMLAKYQNFGIALNGKVVEATVADGYITFTGKISDMEKIAVLGSKISTPGSQGEGETNNGGENNNDDDKSPVTGDSAAAALAIVLFAIAASVVVVSKKKSRA